MCGSEADAVGPRWLLDQFELELGAEAILVTF